MLERGVKESRKPHRALYGLSVGSNRCRTTDSQWCRVAKGRPNVVGDPVLGRKVDLLKELWRDGNASGSPESSQSSIFVVMVVVQVIAAVDGAAAGVVLLDIGHVVGGHVDGMQGGQFVDVEMMYS